MKAEEVTSHARKGAAWSLIVAGIAFPLAPARWVLLGWLGPEVVATFKLLLLFLNAIYTFLFPGGRNVFPAYLPKLNSVEDRSRFVSGFLFLVLGAAAIGIVVTVLWPGLLDLVLGEAVDDRTRLILQCLIPFALLSALANSIVTGSMSFVWGSLLRRSQLVCVTLVALTMWLNRSPSMAADALLYLSGAVAVGALIVMIVSARLLVRQVRLRLRPLFPAGSLKFSAYTYLDTVMAYAYVANDAYFVFFHFGKATLGTYALLLELARIIPMAVQQLGHLLLTTFSKLLGADAHDALVNSYRRITRLTVGFYAAVSLVFVFFAGQITAVCGEEYAAKQGWLIGLAVVMNIDSLRTINGMTLMAFERMPSVFISKLLQNATQLGVTIALIEPFGVYGVILAKALGHVVSAAVLLVATSRLRDTKRLLPPFAYWVSQAVVGLAAWAAFATPDRQSAVSFLAVIAGWVVLWFGGGFRIEDVRSVLPSRRRSEARGE